MTYMVWKISIFCGEEAIFLRKKKERLSGSLICSLNVYIQQFELIKLVLLPILLILWLFGLWMSCVDSNPRDLDCSWLFSYRFIKSWYLDFDWSCTGASWWLKIVFYFSDLVAFMCRQISNKGVSYRSNRSDPLHRKLSKI